MALKQEEFELVLGNKQILSIFFLMVVLFAVFFSFGYSVGYNRGQEESEQAVATLQPIEEEDRVRVPDALLKDAPSLPEEPAAKSTEAKETPRDQQLADASRANAGQTPKPRPFRATKAAPPATRMPQSTTVSGAAVARSIHLQVAALRVHSDAEMLAKKLKDKGYPATLFDQGGDGWHRVLVGPFLSEEAAQQYQQRLKKDGLDSILRKP